MHSSIETCLELFTKQITKAHVTAIFVKEAVSSRYLYKQIDFYAPCFRFNLFSVPHELIFLYKFMNTGPFTCVFLK